MLIDEYDPYADNIGSWRDAIKALATRHKAIVEAMLPELRRRRYAYHISSDALALQIGVSRSLLGMWEAGQRVPAADLFSRWRTILGC